MTEATQTVTLTEFLLARIAEDEAAANEASGRAWASWNRSWDTTGARDIAASALGETEGERIFQVPMPLDEHVARQSPARVLAECEAKRRIVEMHDRRGDRCGGHPGPWMKHGDYGRGFCERADENEWELRYLAAVYSDHPDYRSEWTA